MAGENYEIPRQEQTAVSGLVSDKSAALRLCVPLFDLVIFIIAQESIDRAIQNRDMSGRRSLPWC
jgi:hypothetical protein